MPQFTFKCRKCKKETRKLCSSGCVTAACPFCHGTMTRQMPRPSKAAIKEKVDDLTGITHFDGQEDLIKEKNTEYFYEKDVPRLVASGKYTIEEMVSNGWVYFDIYGKMQIKKYRGQEEEQ